MEKPDWLWKGEGIDDRKAQHSFEALGTRVDEALYLPDEAVVISFLRLVPC